MEIANKLKQKNNIEFKETRKITTLDVNDTYLIEKVRRTKNNYNVKHGSILVECKEFSVFLPNRYSELFTESDIKQLNEKIESGKQIFLKLTMKKISDSKSYINVDFIVEKKKKIS